MNPNPPNPTSPTCTCPPLVNHPTHSGPSSSGTSHSHHNDNHHFLSCPLCLGKFDSLVRVPLALPCGHTICRKCVGQLPPSAPGTGTAAPIPNLALLHWLEFPNCSPGASGLMNLDPDCSASAALLRLCDIAILVRSSTSSHGHQGLSRAIGRKVLNLLLAFAPAAPIGPSRLIRAERSLGERILVEMTAAIGQASHYTAQQQLWAAIRARACQFMGPAMQEEALKLVVLALEDGSPLSRKVLVMFVVQRLTPQFPQASKTAIGHIIQLLYRASAFDVMKRADASSLMTLRPEFRNYEALRREHDSQIVKIGLESGIRFTPEQWSSILYGDTNHKPHMQSIIDKLQAPHGHQAIGHSFTHLTTEFLVNIQRLSEREPGQAEELLAIHPLFQLLGQLSSITSSDATPVTWTTVCPILEAIHGILGAWFRFNPKSKSKHKSGNTGGGRRNLNFRGATGAGAVGQTLQHFPFAGLPIPIAAPAAQAQYFGVGPYPPNIQNFVNGNCGPGPTNTSGFSVLGAGPPSFIDEILTRPGPSSSCAKFPMSAPVGDPGAGAGATGEISRILEESRLLRARIKELQQKNPTAELEAEVNYLDQDLNRLVIGAQSQNN